MLLLERYVSNFTCARPLGTTYFLYVEFSDFYVNQSLAGQTLPLHIANFQNCATELSKKCQLYPTYRVTT
jgi:hypothetical protein